MNGDWFEQLAEQELAGRHVPPVPERFDEQIHKRVNRALLIAHLVELGTRALGFAVLHFSRAFYELVIVSLSGRFLSDRNHRSR
jgi:hypothetical protein